MSLSEDLDSAADDLILATDKLRWLSRLEAKGKLPERLRKKCLALIASTEKTVTRLVRFGKGDDCLSDPSLDWE